LGGAILAETLIDTTIYKDIGTKLPLFRFLAKILLFDLIDVVGIS